MNIKTPEVKPVPWRIWHSSEHGKALDWLLPTPAAVAYFLRNNSAQLEKDGLIIHLPIKGYLIRPSSFIEANILPYFQYRGEQS